MPSTSEAQRRAMFAAASGHSSLGIPQSVGKEFADADKGGKLPSKAKDMAPGKWSKLKELISQWLTEEANEPEHAAEDTDPPKGRASSIAFVTSDGKVLFVKRGDAEENYPSHWAWPGGKADGDETAEDCAMREAREEIGDRAFDGMRQIDQKRTPFGWDHTTYAVPVKDEFEPKLNHEHSAYSWAYADEAPEPLHPGVRKTLDDITAGLGEDAALATAPNSGALPIKTTDDDTIDTATVDIPLLIRLMEYAREDAPDDEALHSATERLTALAQAENRPLVMEDYEKIVGGEKTEDAAADPTGKLSETTREDVDSTKHREDMPASAFLGPNRTYPVKDKNDQGEWAYTRNLLLAAARRARMQGRGDIAKRADAIRAREFPGAEDEIKHDPKTGQFTSAGDHTKQAEYHHAEADKHRDIGANFPLSSHQSAQREHRAAAGMHNRAAENFGGSEYLPFKKGRKEYPGWKQYAENATASAHKISKAAYESEPNREATRAKFHALNKGAKDEVKHDPKTGQFSGSGTVGSNFQQAKIERNKLEAELRKHKSVLDKFPKGKMNLTPDDVKASAEYKEAKQKVARAFNNLREFNGSFTKTYTKEIRNERRAKDASIDREGHLTVGVQTDPNGGFGWAIGGRVGTGKGQMRMSKAVKSGRGLANVVRGAADMALDWAIAEDRRNFDKDGRMHVDSANLTKCGVFEYLGSEVNAVMAGDPNWKKLDPNKRYKLLRPAEEIEKAASTFNGLPILFQHKPASAEDHPTNITVGATGNDSRFEYPYLKNSLVIWPAYASEAVEDGTQKQLSAAYAYRAVVDPGVFEGEHYDFVMVDLIGNHIAQVRDGRSGPTCAIDSKVNIRWAVLEQALLKLT